MKYTWSLIFATTILSCNPSEEKNTAQQPDANQHVKSDTTQGQAKLNTSLLQQAVLEFTDYNDDGDYFLLNAKKGRHTYTFINDQSDDRSLLKGDMINVTWAETTIASAGDKSHQKADKIITIKKIQDGKTSTLRKQYTKQLKYTWPPAESYSRNYLDKLYKIVEYYLANSNNELIKQHIQNNDQLSYSIEKQDRDNKKYILLGISITSEHYQNTIQWLYLDMDTNELYEYDLPKDKLMKFD